MTPNLGVCHSSISSVLSSHPLWILNSRIRGSHLHPTTNSPYPDDLFLGYITAKMSNNSISPRIAARSRKTKQCLANTDTLTSNTTTTDKTKSAIFVQTDQRLPTTTVECGTRIWPNHPNQGTTITISSSTTSTTVPKTRFDLPSYQPISAQEPKLPVISQELSDYDSPESSYEHNK